MKFTLHPTPALNGWTGLRPLPATITTAVTEPRAMAEWELLTAIAGVHGRITAFDLLLNASFQGSQKDTDIDQVLAAFQAYIGPVTMPLSGYNAAESPLSPAATITTHKIDDKNQQSPAI